MPPALTATEFDILARTRDELARAGRGARADILARAARALNCSVQTVYRRLPLAGHSTGRKRRSDAGESLLPDAELELVAGVLKASATGRGQRMPVATALDMLRAGGQLTHAVHESTVSRQLRARLMHPDQMALPSASTQLASLYPNHVWQVDSTTGAFYYMPGGRLRWMAPEQHYKNKHENLVKAGPDLLTMYSVTDHTSHAGKPRFYLGGERVENLLDFLVWAMCQQPGVPMHGVPFILMMDPGPANRSQVLQNFCEALGVRPIWHAPGSARVTGSVEKWHHLVQMHFERRLRFVDRAAVTLDVLNGDALDWANAYCATRKHTRHGKTRWGKWMEILADQLRVPASEAVLREAAVRHPEERRVDNDMTVSWNGKSYSMRGIPGAIAGLKVTLRVNVFRAPAVDVRVTDADTGTVAWHVVEPVVFDSHGFASGAPVIGQEFRGAANSEADDHRNRLLKAAYSLPTLKEAEAARKAHAQAYAGTVDAMADVHATPVPAYLPRRGTELRAERDAVVAPPLNVVLACERLMVMLGAAYGPHVYTYVAATYPDGVPEADLPAIAALFAAPAAEPAAPALRLVNGFGGGVL